MFTFNRLLKYGVPLLITLIAGIYLFLARGTTIANMDNQPLMSVDALTMSSYDLSTGEAVAYKGDFFAGTWDGNLIAYNISKTGTRTVAWQASTALKTQSLNNGVGRKIVTWNGSAGVPFQWGSLNSSQQSTLGGTPTGAYLLNYARGDSTYEGVVPTSSTPAYWPRATKLGAIINSRPYYVVHSSAAKRIYVGANDGMLHAFNADSGTETFAFMPSSMLSKLSSIATNSYVNQTYGVDGQISIAFFQRTVNNIVGNYYMLIGGLGAGGKGVYALNLAKTSASFPRNEADAASMVAWEITSASQGFSNMGYVYGNPVQGKILYASNAAKNRVVLIPNGANSTNGVASFFVVNAIDGTLLKEIVIEKTTGTNGLMGIQTIDSNGDGIIDFVYGGDLNGNIWKCDLSQDFGTDGSNYSCSRFFTPSSGTARPIMVAPTLTPYNGGFMVNFGTGKVLEPADISDTSTDYLYGIWDNGIASSYSGNGFANIVTTNVSNNGTNYRMVSSAPTITYTQAGIRGWRLALPAGERVAGGPLFVDSSRLMVTTMMPNASNTTSYGGWSLQPNAFTGAQPSQAIFDINGDAKLDTSDTISGNIPMGRFLGKGLWSQPILANISSTTGIPLYNKNANDAMSNVLGTATISAGVAHGHFDYDIYYNACNQNANGSVSISNSKLSANNAYKSTCNTNVHVHQYDDKYGVVGVNMLNASNPLINITKALASTQKFKLLIANQKYSPAVYLALNTTSTVSILQPTYLVPLSSDGFVAATEGGPALTFTPASLTQFILEMPQDAFASKDWTGTNDVRAGLIPTQTPCVHSNIGYNVNTDAGAWMNGALTLQLVDSTTTGTMLTADTISPYNRGYRLKKAYFSNQLAQYTIFWHHDSDNYCFGDSGWTAAASQSTDSSTTGSPPDGTADPTGFNPYGNGDSGTYYVYCTAPGNCVPVTQTITYDPITGVFTRIIKASSTDKILLTETYSHAPLDQISDGGSSSSGQPINSTAIGRISWKELIR